MTRILIVVSIIAATLAAVILVKQKPADPPARVLKGHLDLAGAPLRSIQPGEPTTLSFRFQFEGEPTPVRAYDLEHDKLMHTVIMREDLSTFSHVHPTFDPGTAIFNLGIHRPTDDPDNLGTIRAMTQPGKYFVFTEVRPKGDPFIYMDRFTVDVAGEAKPVPLAESPKNVDGDYLQFFTTDSQPAALGDPGYRVRLKVTRREDPKDRVQYFYFETQYGEPPPANTVGMKADYKDVTDFELWLSMPGHAILAGGSGTLGERAFRHMHSMGKTAVDPRSMSVEDMAGSHAAAAKVDGKGARRKPVGPTMLFALPDVEIPPPGLYKVWGQFKHQGRILTFPFVVKI